MDEYVGGISVNYMTNGPITLSTDDDEIEEGQEVAIVYEKTNETIATMQVSEKYTIDKELECKEVFKTTNTDHES